MGGDTVAVMMEPLADRDGHIGGIESLVLDGRRYFFGFDYSSDLVVSPLIGDADAMAAFASVHMRQRTGEHDAEYWSALVAGSVDESALTAGSREFTSTALPRPRSHLLYLLGAATGWDDWFDEDDEARAACVRLHLDTEDPDFLDECLTMLPESADAWIVVRYHLTALLRHLPGNWGVLFAPIGERLRDGVPASGHDRDVVTG